MEESPMRRIHVVFAAAALLAATFTPAAAFASLGSDVALESLSRPMHRSEEGGRGGVDGITLLRLHAGFSLPSGDFGDGFDTGLGFGANIAHGISRTVILSGDVSFHNFDGNGFSGDATVVPITFNVEGVFPSGGKIHPWIGGGVGLYDIDVDTGTFFVPGFGLVSGGSVSETNFGLNFGGGIASRAGAKGV